MYGVALVAFLTDMYSECDIDKLCLISIYQLSEEKFSQYIMVQRYVEGMYAGLRIHILKTFEGWSMFKWRNDVKILFLLKWKKEYFLLLTGSLIIKNDASKYVKFSKMDSVKQCRLVICFKC